MKFVGIIIFKQARAHLLAHNDLNSSISLINRILSGTTTLSQSGSRSNDNEGVLHIPQSSKTDTSLSDGLVSYSEQSVGGSFISAEMQSAYSTASVNWAVKFKDY